MTTVYGGSVFPTDYDSFSPALIDMYDEVMADHPNTALEAVENVQGKLGKDGDPVTGIGGVSFDSAGKSANPGAAGIPTLWVDNTGGANFDLKFTDELGSETSIVRKINTLENQTFDDTMLTGSVAGSGAYYEHEVTVLDDVTAVCQFLHLAIVSGTSADTEVRIYDGDPSGAGEIIYQASGLDLTAEDHKDPNVWWFDITGSTLWFRVYNNGASATSYNLRLRVAVDNTTIFTE